MDAWEPMQNSLENMRDPGFNLNHWHPNYVKYVSLHTTPHLPKFLPHHIVCETWSWNLEPYKVILPPSRIHDKYEFVCVCGCVRSFVRSSVLFGRPCSSLHYYALLLTYNLGYHGPKPIGSHDPWNMDKLQQVVQLFKVGDPIAGTSNSTCDCSRWIGSGSVPSEKRLRDFHFKCYNRSWDVESRIRSQNEDSLPCRPSQPCSLLNLECFFFVFFLVLY